MKPASGADILKTITALVPAMKHKNWDERTSSALLRTYAMDLAEQPLFAIQDACTAYRRLIVGDGWMPLPGELLQETLRKKEWLQKEALEIGRILGAAVTPEKAAEELEVNREKVAAMLDGVRRELSAALPRNERRLMPKVEPEPELSADERLALTAKRYRENPVVISRPLVSARAA